MGGWTEKSARAKSRRKLKAIKHRNTTLAQDVAYEWGDVDQSIVESCDELVSVTERICAEINAYMDERVEGERDD